MVYQGLTGLLFLPESEHRLITSDREKAFFEKGFPLGLEVDDS